MGHKQKLEQASEMSALPPIADIRRCRWDVRYVPIADILGEMHSNPGTVAEIT
jgi:hypothetical protein